MLGAIVDRLEDPDVAARLLDALEAPELAVRLAVVGNGEPEGVVMSSLVRQFLDTASDEQWVQLIGVMQRAEDPTLAALRAILAEALPSLAAAVQVRMPDDQALLAIARALHVLAVAHWIGGVAFVTLIVLPLAQAQRSAELFDAIERRFARQVRVSVPLAGATGLWMTWRLDLWHRFVDADAWWMAAMLGLWLVFMLMLFVIEPVLHAGLAARLRLAPLPMLRWAGRLHAVLLALAAGTILGAVAGSHGGVF